MDGFAVSRRAAPADPGEGELPKPRIGVGTHYVRYSSANFMVLLAGFVSFPLLTRLLDNTQYGILGYYETWVAIAVALVKFGSQHSVMRFYPHGAEPGRLRHFATNLVYLPLLLSMSAWALAALTLGAVEWLTSADFPPVFWCALFLVPLVVLGSLMDIVLQASERSMLLMVTRVCKRWVELGLILLVVVLVERSALSVYFGKLAAAAAVALFYIQWLYRNLPAQRSLLDRPAVRESMVYGVPLVANELAWVLLDSIDRVMIRHLLGNFAAVGVYTIGYSLAMNVRLFMNSTLHEAFVPVANRIHGSAGDSAVRALKDRILLPMTYASVGVAAMLLGIGQEALVALSGPSKAASGEIFVIVGIAFALYPLLSVSNYGLLLHKRSMVVFASTLGAALFNIALNFALIPRFGILGAAWAAVASYGALALANCLLCPRGLLRFPQPRAVVIALGCAAVLLLAIDAVKPMAPANPWLVLPVAGVLGLALYVLPVWLLDSRLRHALRNWRKPPDAA